MEITSGLSVVVKIEEDGEAIGVIDVAEEDGEAIGVIAGFGVGEAVGVIAGFGVGEAVLILTPLSQTSLDPDLMQVNFFPDEKEVALSLEQVEPDFIAAFEIAGN